MAAATPAPIITNNAVATKSSLVPVEASKRKSGLRNNRPMIMIPAMASAAFESASIRLVMIELLAPAPNMETKSRIGITAKSCASNTEKLARPAAVARRPWLESTSTTIAVEDNARQAPRMIDTAGVLPANTAIPPIAAAESTICRLPSPNTRRRMAFNRS